MKAKKKYAIIIFMLQGLAEIICNATEEESQRVVLNDFSEIENNLEPIEAYHQRLDEIKRINKFIYKLCTGGVINLKFKAVYIIRC